MGLKKVLGSIGKSDDDLFCPNYRHTVHFVDLKQKTSAHIYSGSFRVDESRHEDCMMKPGALAQQYVIVLPAVSQDRIENINMVT